MDGKLAVIRKSQAFKKKPGICVGQAVRERIYGCDLLHKPAAGTQQGGIKGVIPTWKRER